MGPSHESFIFLNDLAATRLISFSGVDFWVVLPQPTQSVFYGCAVLFITLRGITYIVSISPLLCLILIVAGRIPRLPG